MATTEREIEATLERQRREAALADPFWPAQLAVLAALILYVVLPDKLTIGPDWLLPAAEGVLLAGLVWASPRRRRGMRPHPWRRRIAMGLSIFVALVNLVALGLLIHFVIKGGRAGGYELVLSGAEIWATSVLIFAVIYWEIDGGGPTGRASGRHPRRGSSPSLSGSTWAGRTGATFVDYLYRSFTNCTAFSPTDTMPLTSGMKLLMMFQGLGALVTIGVIIARAISALG